VLRFLQTRISEIKALLAKHMGSTMGGEIERIAARLAELVPLTEAAETIEYEALDRDLGILDHLLVAALEPCVPQEEKEAWEKEARKELKIYKKQLPKETYARILDNYMRGRVHRFFRVGELSLFHIRSRS